MKLGEGLTLLGLARVAGAVITGVGAVIIGAPILLPIAAVGAITGGAMVAAGASMDDK